jgi:hypothetical protein
MFHQWKALLKRHYIDFNFNWLDVHNSAITNVTTQQGLNFFKMTTLFELIDNHPLYQSKDEDQVDEVV